MDVVTPFRFRSVADQLLLTNEAGDYAFTDNDFLTRYFNGKTMPEDRAFLARTGITFDSEETWRLISLARRVQERVRPKSEYFNYLIVVPTLRCNLSCSYCQVSRAPLDATGFDWQEDQISDFDRFLAETPGEGIKIEFQGGEPSLRPDLLRRLIEITQRHFKRPEFVVCTNLQNLTPEFEDLIARDDLTLSTSMDGNVGSMTANRTKDDAASKAFFANLNLILKKYGTAKISALPTITEETISKPEEVIDLYRSFGFSGIFLRPVNYMGFARKQHANLSHDIDRWNGFYWRAIAHIRNISENQYFEEQYLAMLVRSIFANARHGYVDLRSPARYGADYCVIDFDGRIYPTDEARMLTRVRQIDLSIGSLASGIDLTRVTPLNATAMHHGNPDCVHCAYMPYCGIDIIDDISRNGRVDVPKSETWFCARHISMFDFIFEQVANRNRPYLDLFLQWIYRQAKPTRTFELFYDSASD